LDDLGGSAHDSNRLQLWQTTSEAVQILDEISLFIPIATWKSQMSKSWMRNFLVKKVQRWNVAEIKIQFSQFGKGERKG